VRIVALLLLLCAALLVVSVGLTIYGFAVHDPLDPPDQVVAAAVALGSLAFLARATWKWRRERTNVTPTVSVASATPILIGVGAFTGVVVLAFLIWAHTRAGTK
jgi:hypothetical protein